MNLSLYMFKADGEPKAFKIDRDKTFIGRREDCDLRIPLSQISRKHAVLTVQENIALIRDLDSINGTFVNNKRVSEQQLAAGDHIVIGPVVFTVQIDGEPDKIKRVRTRVESREQIAGEGDIASAVTAAADKDSDDFDLDLDQSDDPISALEALAGSGDTKQINMDDSNIDLTLDDSQL